MRAVRTISSLVSVAGTCDKRDVNGHRHHQQVRAGKQHHRLVVAASGPPRQFAKKLGVAGMGEAGVVERLLVDRIGNDTRRGSAHRVADGALDRRDHRVRIRRIGGSRRVRDRFLERHDGEVVRESLTAPLPASVRRAAR